MNDETFSCDRCGRETPRRQLKEVFTDEGARRELCPQCLDEVMNASDRVEGVAPGDEKQAAARVHGQDEV